MLEIRRQLLGHLGCTHTDHDLDPRVAQGRDAAPEDAGVGVAHPDHHPGDAGVDDRFGARGGAAVMRAGLERRVERGPLGLTAGDRRIQRDHLGVRTARWRRRPFEGSTALGGHDDAAHPGIGGGHRPHGRRQGHGPGHVGRVVRCRHGGRARASASLGQGGEELLVRGTAHDQILVRAAEQSRVPQRLSENQAAGPDRGM